MRKSRVLIIGSETAGGHDREELARASRSLGRHLGNGGFPIVVCSPHGSSADRYVVEGYADSGGNIAGAVTIHHPNDHRVDLSPGESIPEQWEQLFAQTGIVGPVPRFHAKADIGRDGFMWAYLLCQIRALEEDTDVVVTVGGKLQGAASFVLAIARHSYPIIPFAFLGGQAKQEFFIHEAELRGRLGGDLVNALRSPTGVERIGELVGNVRRRSPKSRRIFISYPWKRARSADLVEAFLRRTQNVTVFRDETNIKSGDSITETILEEIMQCEVFLVLWCAEYAASPHCYDEFQRFIDIRNDARVFILRLDDTRPIPEEVYAYRTQR